MSPRVNKDFFPPPETLLALDPEQVAIYVLRKLCLNKGTGVMNRHNLTASHNLVAYAPDEEERRRIAIAMQRGLEVLLARGYVVPDPFQGEGWLIVTEEGEAADNDWESAASSYPDRDFKLSDAMLTKEVLPIYLRGDTDKAVWEAFKIVEIRVRAAGGFSSSDIGVGLMRKAFHPETGPLTDYDNDMGERQGMSDLFAGSIARLKNPGSHRKVILDIEDARQLLGLADYLLRYIGEADSAGEDR